VIGLRPELPLGHRLVCYDSVGSTNDEARHLARDGAEEDTVVWALEQTHGRGRRGRVWVSPRGNLYASLILRPDCPPLQAAQLGFVAAIAIGSALGTILPRLNGLSYKWPNDVLVNGRKIAGILLESEIIAADKPTFLILGIGVNLVSSPPLAGYPTTSISEEGLGAVPPAAMLEEFCRHFCLWKKRWRDEGFVPVRAAWLAHAAAREELIQVRLEAGILYGRFLGIDDLGALLLEGAEEQHRISAGDVLLMNQ
jgi:BirA family biotin operon repressor/biotin-[acetyl-CoA-carboxylase] ligase